MAVAVLNDYREEHSLELYGYTAVYNCYVRMKPKVVRFRKRQQGNKDPESGWAMSRVRILKQILLQQGKVEEDDKKK